MQTTLDMEHAINSQNDTRNADVSERLSGLLATVERLHSQWKSERTERERLQQTLFDKRTELYQATSQLAVVKNELRQEVLVPQCSAMPRCLTISRCAKQLLAFLQCVERWVTHITAVHRMSLQRTTGDSRKPASPSHSSKQCPGDNEGGAGRGQRPLCITRVAAG
jgi:chromosome segregation ATPase